jgi:RHS repeat-associated protein
MSELGWIHEELITLTKEFQYDSFGNITSETNTTFRYPKTFAGGLHDPDTGLVRFGFPYHDPEIGRWTAKDPIQFAGGQENLYVYVGNSPVMFNDKLGLWVHIAVGVGAGALGGAGGAAVGAGLGEFLFGDDPSVSSVLGAGAGAYVSGYLPGLDNATQLEKALFAANAAIWGGLGQSAGEFADGFINPQQANARQHGGSPCPPPAGAFWLPSWKPRMKSTSLFWAVRNSPL